MLARLAAITALFAAASLGSAGEAAAFRFGKDEALHRIPGVVVHAADGDEMTLAYKTTTIWFFGGIYVSDDGYAFAFKSNARKYVSLTPEMIAMLQAGGLVPTPLPSYKLSTVDYVLGYSLWTLLLPFLMIYGVWKAWRYALRSPVA
jgi:hypothetical protein